MKKVGLIYHFISWCLVVLVLVSSMGIIVDMHYCNNELKSFSFIGKAKPCHEPSLKQCPFHNKILGNKKNDSSVNKKGCCENKTKFFHSDQDQQIQTFDYELTRPFQLFIGAYINAFFISSGIEKEILAFTRYKPPIIQRDIPVLIQSFLL